MAIDTAVWRNHGQLMHLKAAFIKPVTVFARRINQASFTFPLAQLTYDNPDGGTGVYTDVKEGMTLGVYSSSDVFKGFLRVRKAPTASVLYVSEVAAGDVTFADNDKLVVYDDYRLWARVPRMTSTKVFYKDYDLTYASQITYDGSGDKLLPVANTGPHYAGDVVGTTVDIAFNGANSFRQAAGISDALTYVWDFKDGTVISGSHLLAAATVRFPAGQRWVGLTVTDGNSKSSRAVCAVMTRNTSTYPYVPVALQRLSGSVDSGWECAVSVLASDVSDLLPGTLMILYSDQYYDSIADNVNGYAGREHILFVGWVDSEDLTVEPFQDELIITARSALGILQTLPAFTASIERNLFPAKWHHQIYPNWFRGLVYLMQWHSTIALVCDVERPSFWGDYLFPAADYSAGSLYDQLRTEAERAWARLTEDKTGRLLVRRNPHLMNTTERAALAVTVHLQSTDWREAVQIQRPARPRTGWIRGAGFTNNAGDLKLSLAPGDAPGQGVNQSEKNGMWITDQADLNTRLGHAYAYENNETPYLQLTLNHQGAGFDPGWQEAVEFTLDDTTNRRGLGFTQDKFIPVSYDIGHDPETGATTEVLTLEALTDGVPGTTQLVPNGDWADEDWRPPDIDIDPYEPPPPAITPGGSGLKSALVGLVVKNSGGDRWGAISVIDDLVAGTWSILQTGLPVAFTYGVSEPYYINTDPYSPDRAILFTVEGGIYENTAWKTAGAWSTLVTPAALLAAVQAVYPAMSAIRIEDAALSMAEAGLFYLALTEGVEEAVTVVQIKSYGSTINVAPYKFWFPLMSVGVEPLRPVNIQASNVTPNTFYLATHSNDGSIGRRYAYLHINTWGTWTPLSGSYVMPVWEDSNTGTGVLGTATFVPFFKADGSINNPETELYYLRADARIKRSTDGGSTFSNWSPADYSPAQEAYSNSVARRDMFEVQGETNEMAFFIRCSTANDGFYTIARGDDPALAGSWVQRALPVNQVGWVGGWPFSDSQFYLGAGEVSDLNANTALLWVTTDSGVNWTDITHNLRSLSNYAGNGGNLHRVIRLTPHTTET